MDLANVTILVESVQAGSLAAAGRRIGITAMAASRRLAALEEELGVRLVHRTTRSLSLTPEGEAFLPHARAMLEQEADGRAAIRPSGAGASGLLRIATSVPFGRKVVMPMMAGFLRDNPEVRVDLLLNDAIVDIVGNGIDLAIRIAELRDNLLVARRLADNPRVLCASPEYIARAGTPIVLGELAAQDCLVVSGTTHWTFERGDRPVQQQISARFTANSIEALHRACLDGLGIARLSLWNVQEDLASGRLVAIKLADGAIAQQAIWAVYPTAHFVPVKVRLFVEALRAHLDSR